MQDIIQKTGLKNVVEEWETHAQDPKKSLDSFLQATKCLVTIYDNCVLTKNKKDFSTEFSIENLGTIIQWVAATLAKDDQKCKEALIGAFAVEIQRHQSIVFNTHKPKIQDVDIPVDHVMSSLAVTDEKKDELLDATKDDDEQEAKEAAKEAVAEDEGSEDEDEDVEEEDEDEEEEDEEEYEGEDSEMHS